MKITILGAGNMGCANAADLTLKGHEVTLVKTSHSMHNETFNYVCAHNNEITLWQEGEEQTARIHAVTTDLSSVATADLVYITTQTNVHEQLIQRIAPLLRKGQVVLISPGYFSTAYFLRHCPDKDLTIIEGESSTIDCRVDDTGFVRVGFRNVRNPVGVYPVENLPKVRDMLESMQFHYVYLSSVVEAALHNPNMMVHTVGAVMSIPRIEKTKGDYCMYWEVWTPSVYRILDQLDKEKMDVLEHLGYERLLRRLQVPQQPGRFHRRPRRVRGVRRLAVPRQGPRGGGLPLHLRGRAPGSGDAGISGPAPEHPHAGVYRPH